MADQKKTFADTIRVIYFYFFAGLGLILFIIGFFQLSNWGVRSFLLPKYSLDFEDSRCDYTIPVKPDGTPANSLAESERQKCLASLENQRKIKQVTDLAQALTFILVGGVVFIFHFRKTNLLHK